MRPGTATPVIGLLAWAGAATGALAQDADSPAALTPPEVTEQASGVTAYPASFFDQFLPNNANDMISKLPGFTFSRGEDVRGFAGAAGNVLIDGVRPTSKAVSLETVLQRIPTGSVDRIEVVRGGAPGIDMQGQPVVANVIRKGGAESNSAFQILFKPYQDGQVGVIPRVEHSFRTGPISFEGQIGGRRDKFPDSGVGRLVRIGPGVNEAGRFSTDVQQYQIQANGAFEYRVGGGDLVHLNGSAERQDSIRDEMSQPVSAITGLGYNELSRTKLRNDKAEIGGDYRHVFTGKLSGQIIGLQTFKTDTLRSATWGRANPVAATEDAKTRESIGRMVLTYAASTRLRFEGGVEGALNSLDSRSSLSQNGVPVVIPSANVRVEETRGEVFGTVNLAATKDLNVELGTRVEASKIEQSGGADQSRNLSFVKPRLIAAYNLGANTQVRVRVERTVGQLNFKDFAASSSLEAGTVNAGNPDLQPQRAWVFESALEQRFWGSGSIVVTFAHSELQEVADLIPVRGFDAPGNIGDGKQDELRVALTLPLDKVGIANGLVRFNGVWKWSQVTDPVTGRVRRISGQRPFDTDIYIGKQFPSLKSTLAAEAQLGYYETYYRISEIRTNREQPLWKIYWDWAPKPDLVFRFQVENFTAKSRLRYRTLFNGPRSNDQIAVKEERYGKLKPFLMIRTRKTF
jgi:outer membrane receptor for ferrienterochelin and colicin